MRFALTTILMWICLTGVWGASFDSIHGARNRDSSTSGDLAAKLEPPVLETPAATTVRESVQPTERPSTDLPVAATPQEYEYVEIPIATANSNTFRKVPRRVCPEEVSAKIMFVYKKNREVFNLCAAESHYQIFPYSGAQLTDSQLQAFVKSTACRAIATLCVVANVPECDISDLPLKAVTETLLKLIADVKSGTLKAHEVNHSLFFALYQWRRDVNLAQTANVPFGGDSLLYKDFTTSLQTARVDPTVSVSSDLTITLADNVGSDQDRPHSGTTQDSQLSTSEANQSASSSRQDQRPSPPVSIARPAQGWGETTALLVLVSVVGLWL